MRAPTRAEILCAMTSSPALLGLVSGTGQPQLLMSQRVGNSGSEWFNAKGTEIGRAQATIYGENEWKQKWKWKVIVAPFCPPRRFEAETDLSDRCKKPTSRVASDGYSRLQPRILPRSAMYSTYGL